MKKLLSILMLLGLVAGAMGCKKEEVVINEETTAVEPAPVESAPAVEDAATETTPDPAPARK
ncbi:MAG: hypothetical protein ABII74_10715 [Elusimicrobiota bacterium]